MTLRLVVPSLVAVSLLLTACGTQAPPAPVTQPAAPSALQDAQALWQDRGPAAYRMTLVGSCGERGGLGVYEVEVSPAGSRARPEHRWQGASTVVTVEDLFAFIDEAATAGADVVDVQYDPDLGYPTDIEIDQMTNAIDDEACYAVKDFTVTAG